MHNSYLSLMLSYPLYSNLFHGFNDKLFKVLVWIEPNERGVGRIVF